MKGKPWGVLRVHVNRTVGMILLTLMLSVFPVTGASQEPATIRITNGEWPPYLGSEEPYYGLASRIVTEAFERAGYRVEYGFFPWSRSLYLAREGVWDGTAVWFSNPERVRNFHLSDPIILSEYVFFHRNDLVFDWETVGDLAGYQIGITSDYAYGEAFDRAVAEGVIETETVFRDELNFRKLLMGRIDLFPIDLVVAAHMIDREFDAEEAARLAWHPRPIRSDRLKLMLSRHVPENEERIEAFNQALMEMRREGRIEDLIIESLGRTIPVHGVVPRD